jgi:hypothetical protein
MQVIRRNFIETTMNNPCCCDFIYHLGLVGTHQRCKFLDLDFSSVCSWPTGSLSSSKLFLPCAKRLFYLNTVLGPKAPSLYVCLIIWNVSLADLPNFLAEFDVFPLIKLGYSWFPPLAGNYFSQQWLSIWIHRLATTSCSDERRTEPRQNLAAPSIRSSQ